MFFPLIKKQQNLIEKIKTAMQSEYFSVFLLLFGIICWFFNLTAILVLFYVVIFILTLIFCEDVKNIFSMIFFVAFYIDSITSENPPWDLYVGAIFLAFVCLVCFFIKNFSLNAKSLKPGKMWKAFVAAGIAFALGGISKFNFLTFLITIALFFATYVLYFIIINFTKNFKDYFIKLFIYASLMLTVQIILDGILKNAFAFDKPGKLVVLGTQNVNVLAEYFLVGIACVFALTIGKKSDWLGIIVVAIIEIGIFITRCRTVYALSILMIVFLMTLAIIKSPRKLILLIETILIISAIILFLAIKRDLVIAILKPILEKMNQLNGREELWPWCLNLFKEAPLFGNGFVANELPPEIILNKLNIILAHNSLVQWLCSLGIVGTMLMGYFYYCKYDVLLKNLTLEKFVYATAVLGIALSGILDQAPTMDFFVFLMPLAIVASVEN